MLKALADLGAVGTRVINASKADTRRHLRALAADPHQARRGRATTCPGALEILVTYPFPQAATGAVQGDYTNLRITADLDLRTILTNLNGGKNPGCRRCLPVPNPTGPPADGDGPQRPAALARRLPVPLPTSTTAVPLAVATPASAGICIGRPGRHDLGRLRHQPGPADDGGPRHDPPRRQDPAGRLPA